MKKPMTKVVVPVSFTGTVEVEIPAAIPPERREMLASKVRSPGCWRIESGC